MYFNFDLPSLFAFSPTSPTMIISPLHKLINLPILIILLTTPPFTTAGGCPNTSEPGLHPGPTREALNFKLAAIASVLAAGALGVGLPLLGQKLPGLRPENDIFFMIKDFAAGVILGTGFIHILPDAFETLASPCLGEDPWGKFPFVGFIAMLAAIGTLMVDTFATSFYKRVHFEKGKRAKHVADEEGVGVSDGQDDEHARHVHVHTHATHGHAHGAAVPSQGQSSPSDLVRHRIISQVLELGIVTHSVIIGISLGASQSSVTIKPLLAALSFHQFFEGMGLGGCISQARFKSLTTTVMMLFFSLTTPIGIGVGIGISRFYNENSPKALVVEGIFNSASAGILIYMALVDLLAADFMNPKMQSNVRLQLGAHISLLLGAACMAFLAKWA